MIKRIEKYQYPTLECVTKESGSRYYVEPTNNNKLSSVTTIIGATSDKSFLIKWREWIGDKEADRIVKEACNIGTLLHENMENYMLGIQKKSGSNMIHRQAKIMSDHIIKNGLSKNITDIYGIEAQLYYSGLYAGSADLIAVHKGELAICDFKNSKKIKKEEWVEGYYLQGVAYAMAHNKMFGTNIRKIVIMMVTRPVTPMDKDLEYKEFILEGKKFDKYHDMWIDRLEQFYNQKG